jgi:hypothetical protein
MDKDEKKEDENELDKARITRRSMVLYNSDCERLRVKSV